MINNILKTSKYDNILDTSKGVKKYKNSNDSFNAHLIAQDFKYNQKTIFVVLPNLYEAQKYYDILNQLVESDDVLFYPMDQILTMIMALGSIEFKSERLFTLRQLLTNKPFIVVTTTLGIKTRQLSKSDYINSIKVIEENKEYEMDKLVRFLVSSGFVRNYIVENPGEFSVRGSILDIFTLDNKEPYRLDFFGDTLESIKIFDVETQRSSAKITKFQISPMSEVFYTDEMKDLAINKIENFFKDFSLSNREKEKLNEDLESISTRSKLDSLLMYIPFFNNEETTILDFVEDKKIIYIDVDKMRINEETTKSDLNTYAVTMNGSSFLEIPFLVDFESQLKTYNNRIEIYNFGATNDDLINLNIIEVNNYRGNLTLFMHDIKEMKDDFRVLLCIHTKAYYEEVKSFLKDNNIEYSKTLLEKPGIYLLDEASYGSFIAIDLKVVVIDETKLFSYKLRPQVKYRSVLNQSTKVRHVDELSVGDYLVHYDYGIGQYMGLKTMDLSGEKRDYLHIIYADNEALYVPMDQINLVLKYGSYDGVKPKLSKLGGKQWSKTKASVRMKIKDLSDRLIKLYAERNQSVGFAFSKDNEMQKQFELDFNYQTTKDQEKAIIETKFDMENEKPMDRLICGDVGFGKTEVALRAAFKAVLDAKQVLYLVPTTVLARQHYYTFKERFERYGANVALLSRFVTPKKQKETISKLKEGYIDVVIGTHRVLSNDIVFKDLGLLIIDEEQRFGVEHKEKIKEIKVNVDTLTLSATPIPRTLQMAMMGLKDLSMIETPPMNRYPIQTYVVERQDALTREAITREIARGGQIFYLFNRVQGIEGMVERLRNLVPEARVTFAHGKMHRDQLEGVLSDFIDHEYDILVSTTIIETGIDIPNTNTLIIHDADQLGLSQLYQIRGRVGRSDRIAYAYLLYDRQKNINDEAKKRLSAIEDFTALGSGYKIALRDLSIRGAGDVLGHEQSGFIDSVGIELYMKLLDEALTGNLIDEGRDTAVDEVYAARHVDPDYVSKDSIRIEIHKRIGDLNGIDDVNNLKEELTDRFGPIDADLLLYMYEKVYKKLSSKLGVQKTQLGVGVVTMILSIEASQNVDGQKLFEKASTFKLPVSLAYIKEKIQINMVIKGQKEHWLYLADLFLDEYFNK